MPDDDAPNEILAAARDAKLAEEAAARNAKERAQRRWNVGRIGLGVGIGSAAVAAAVLYANRDRDAKK